jgi:hypothetical protein
VDPRRPDSAAGFPGTAHGQAGQGRRSRVDNGSFKYLCPVATDRTDPVPGDRALVPILDLAQDRFQILRYRFRAHLLWLAVESGTPLSGNTWQVFLLQSLRFWRA